MELFKIIKMLILHKDFVREFNIIETLIAFAENLFEILNNKTKSFYCDLAKWE